MSTTPKKDQPQKPGKPSQPPKTSTPPAPAGAKPGTSQPGTPPKK
jgi:hypothetical protein